MKDKTSSIIVTASIALCLVAVVVAVAVLLVGQHAVPSVAVGLVTTLAAFLAPSPLGHGGLAGGVESAIGGLLSHSTVTATTGPAESVPGIDLTTPAPSPSAP